MNRASSRVSTPPGVAGCSHSLPGMTVPPGRLSVERALAEVRQARPVRLWAEGQAPVGILAAETLSPDSLEALATHPATLGLLLSPLRLRHLGVSVQGPALIPYVPPSQAQVDSLILGAGPVDLSALGPVRAACAAGEAAIELVRLAQMLPAAVLVDAAALPDWTLSVEAADVMAFHDAWAASLTIAARCTVPLADSTRAEFVVFGGGDGLRDQVAIIVGQPDLSQPVPVRMHSACLTGDLFASLKCDCGEQLRSAVARMEAAGAGILLYLDQEGRGIGLRNKIRTYKLQESGLDTVDSDAVLGFGPDERRYALAGRMLRALDATRVALMTNNPAKLAALTAEGIEITGDERLHGTENPHNRRYLRAKAERKGHLLNGADGG